MINLKISAIAFLKMQTLVAGYDHEVGWYGTAEKIDDHTYRITDILVYPQYASAAYIDDKDTTEMPLWFQSLSDEVYNHKRFHGHSHVDMGVSPSGTDLSMYRQFEEQNAKARMNRFSIELIMNKRFEMFWRVHDAEKNKLYTNSEISVEIEITEEETMATYFEKSREQVKLLKECKDFIVPGTPKKVEDRTQRYGGRYSTFYGNRNYNKKNKNSERKSQKKENSQVSSTESKKENKITELRLAKKKFVVCNHRAGIKVSKGCFVDVNNIVFDVYENAYKILQNTANQNTASTGTVFSTLLSYINEPTKWVPARCDCFMIFDIKKSDMLFPDNYKHLEEMFQMKIIDTDYIEEKGVKIFVLYV